MEGHPVRGGGGVAVRGGGGGSAVEAAQEARGTLERRSLLVLDHQAPLQRAGRYPAWAVKQGRCIMPHLKKAAKNQVNISLRSSAVAQAPWLMCVPLYTSK